MINSWRLYCCYVRVAIRAQLQYRVSFLFMTFGYFIMTTSELLALWVLFHRFHAIADWTFAEVALLYGMTQVSFALAEASSRGFDQFSNQVRSGDFDILLLRPRSTALQVAGQEFALFRLGRLVQGLFVLIWAGVELSATWTPGAPLLILFAMIGSGCLFYGLFVLQATLAFWTTETLEIMNILTFGGQETARYPIKIYPDWFRLCFTFVIPLAFVAYFPMLTAISREEIAVWAGWLAPLVGVLFLLVSLALWNLGVRHYRSTGS